MSISDSIREMLDILDPNIEILVNEELAGSGFYSKVFRKGESCHIIKGTLVYLPEACLHCGCENKDGSITKYGFKTVMTQLNKVSEYKTYLELRKQKFHCANCGRTFLAESTLTKRNCSIATRVKLKIATMLEEPVSMTYIAKQTSVAPMTVLRVLREFYQPIHPHKTKLPEVLCFDEFKSGKFADGSMSCILMDGKQTKLLDVIEDRKKENLRNYFLRFPLEERKRVSYVISDFYAPYITLSKEIFPNAAGLIDRFHICQLIGRSFQSQRTAIMKTFSKKDKRYRHLKKYWKLLQMNTSKIDYERRYWRPSFRDHLTQSEIVERLLSYSPELRQGYEVYQAFLRVIRYSEDANVQKERTQTFHELLSLELSALPETFQTTITTYKKYEEEITRALILPYSNGPVEATNNHIKVIKRMAYGFRNFINFKTRIFLNRGTYFKTVSKKPSDPHRQEKRDQAAKAA